MFIGVLIVIILITFLISKFVLNDSFVRIKQEAIKEIEDEYFREKDILVKEEIKISKNLSIKLYDVRYVEDIFELDKDEEGNVIYDANKHSYSRIAEIVNKNTKFVFPKGVKSEEVGVDVELVDFHKKENELLYIEMIEMVTNFNLAQFVFKNKKGEVNFELLNLELDVVDKMKTHTDEIIHEVFLKNIELMIDNNDTGMLAQAFSNEFLK